ncbi:MAG: hypothetical protein IGNPGNKH_00186 [Sodalis sp. Ffu]|nr:MAG: hypothetical protein IGNPGNKH_00186 [Sodalis sp. Ffu]
MTSQRHLQCIMQLYRIIFGAHQHTLVNTLSNTHWLLLHLYAANTAQKYSQADSIALGQAIPNTIHQQIDLNY